MKDLKLFECVICGVGFYVKHKYKRKYCSEHCKKVHIQELNKKYNDSHRLEPVVSFCIDCNIPLGFVKNRRCIDCNKVRLKELMRKHNKLQVIRLKERTRKIKNLDENDFFKFAMGKLKI